MAALAPLTDQVRFANGDVAVGARVSVVLRGTSTLVSIYAAPTGGQTISNPTRTDGNGCIRGYVATQVQLTMNIYDGAGNVIGTQEIEPNSAAETGTWTVAGAGPVSARSDWVYLQGTSPYVDYATYFSPSSGWQNSGIFKTSEGLVVLNGMWDVPSASSANSTVCNIPVGYRPGFYAWPVAICWNGTNYDQRPMYIQPTAAGGNLVLASGAGVPAGGWIAMMATWRAEG